MYILIILVSYWILFVTLSFEILEIFQYSRNLSDNGISQVGMKIYLTKLIKRQVRLKMGQLKLEGLLLLEPIIFKITILQFCFILMVSSLFFLLFLLLGEFLFLLKNLYFIVTRLRIPTSFRGDLSWLVLFRYKRYQLVTFMIILLFFIKVFGSCDSKLNFFTP